MKVKNERKVVKTMNNERKAVWNRLPVCLLVLSGFVGLLEKEIINSKEPVDRGGWQIDFVAKIHNLHHARNYFSLWFCYCCCLTDWPTDWLTPWSWVLQKPPVAQLFKNFPTCHGTRRFITVFTGALHRSLSWARSVQSIPQRPVSVRTVYRVEMFC
jgi:hypothetical protein